MDLVTFVVGSDSRAAENACKTLWAVDKKEKKKLFRVGVFDANGNLLIESDLKKKLLPKVNATDFEWNGKYSKNTLRKLSDMISHLETDEFESLIEDVKEYTAPSSEVEKEFKPTKESIGLLPIFAKSKSNSNKKTIMNFEFDLDSYSIIQNEAAFADMDKQDGDTEWIDKDEIEFDLCSLTSAADMKQKEEAITTTNLSTSSITDQTSIASPKASMKSADLDEWSVVSTSDANASASASTTNAPFSFRAALMKNSVNTVGGTAGPNIHPIASKSKAITPNNNKTESRRKSNKDNTNQNKKKSIQSSSLADEYFENKYQNSMQYLHGNKR